MTDVDVSKLGTLGRHGACVVSLAFAPDNSLLVSGSEDETFKLWELSTPSLCKTVPCQASVDDIAFSHDGKLMAIACKKSGQNFGQVMLKGLLGTFSDLRLWDVEQEKEVRRISIQGVGRITSVAFSPTDPLVATGEVKFTTKLHNKPICRIWNRDNGRQIKSFSHEESESGFECVRFSPDGLFLVAAGEFVMLWAVRDVKFIGEVYGGEALWGSVVAFSPDSSHLVVGSRIFAYLGQDHGCVKLYRVPDLDLVTEFKGHTENVVFVAFSPDGQVLITADYGGVVRFWNVRNGHPLGQIQLDFSCLAISHDGQLLAVGTEDGAITLWQLSYGPDLLDQNNSSDNLLDQETHLEAVSGENRSIWSKNATLTTNFSDQSVKRLLAFNRSVTAAP